MTTIYDLLKNIVKYATNENWDGYGAASVLEDSIKHTVEFIEKLPQKYSLPIDDDTFCVDPDGEVSFDWYKAESHNVFSVSVGADGKFAYAWYFNSIDASVDKGYGFTYNQDEMLEIIEKKLKDGGLTEW